VSLIEEALKRARDESARQEEEHRRGQRPWVPPPPKKPRRRAPAVAAFAAGIAVLAAGAWLLVHRLPAPAPARPRGDAPAAKPPAGAASTGSAPVRADSPLPPVAESVEVPPSAAPKARAEEPPASREARTRPEPPTAVSAPASPPAAAPAPSRPALRDGKSFVRVVDVPGEDRIELEGIVYSETNPVAVIGGRVLAPGAFVGDFQVVRIEEDRVTLRGRGVTIYVTLG